MLEKNILQRHILFKELSIALKYPLTTMVAPMGYGKTTAAIEYFKARNTNHYWFSFETDEHSPKFIWDTFARQLKSKDEVLGDRLKRMGFPLLTPQRNHFFSLLQSRAKDTPLHIAIDDYQYNKSATFDEFIELLVRADFHNIHILLISRVVPNLNIEDLKLKNKCYCITQKCFLLSKDEVGKLYHINHISAQKDIILKTHEQAEGWISAALLLMHKYQETGLLDSIEPIESLIKSSIMKKNNRDPECIALLGILDSFSIDQLTYTLGALKTTQLIDKLLKNGVFLHYDAESKRYRIHNIFKNYLYEYEFQKLAPELQNTYYSKTGKWQVSNNYILDGIRCFIKSKEYVEILKEFEKGTIRKIYDHDPKSIITIMEQIPKELKFQYPIAYLSYLHFLISSHNITLGAKLLYELDLKIKRNEIEIDTNLLKIDGEIEFLKSLMAYNDISVIFSKQKRAYEILGGSSKIARLDKMPCSGSFSILFLYYKHKYTLKKTALLIKDNIKYYERLANRIGTGLNDAVMAEYYIEIDELEQAEFYAQKAILRAKKALQYDTLICATLTLARCKIAKGELKESLNLMESLTDDNTLEITSLFYSSRSPYYLAKDALNIKTGHYELLRENIIHRKLEAHLFFFQSKGLSYILYGHFLLHQEKYLDLELLLEETNLIFAPFNNLIGYIHLYLLQSIATMHLYGMKAAIKSFKKVITICRCDQIITSVAEYGHLILPILEAYVATEYEDDYLIKLVSKTKNYAQNWAFYHNFSHQFNLTLRENEVMVLLKTGKTNKQIGKELFISESAIKKSLTSIYKKLDAHNRTEAIKIYTENHL